MPRKDMRILVVAEDGPDAAELISNLVMNLDADFAHVESIDDARDLLDEQEFDAVIATQSLADGSGFDLIVGDEPIGAPVVLIEDELVSDRLVTALRCGAADVLPTPIDYDYLVRCVRRVVRHHKSGRQEAIRAKRLRRLSSRLVKDRRELRKRVDLICNDIVTAYQRLAEKVVGVIEPQGGGGSDEFDAEDFSVRLKD